MHFLKVLVPSHKPNEDLFESTNLFHVLGEAKEAYLRLVEVTILEDDASRSYIEKSLIIFLAILIFMKNMWNCLTISVIISVTAQT